jgi:hypothetical protein
MEQLFSVNLPEVNAFAVSNLLFPGQNVFSFGEANVPGDLIIFGTIQAPSVSVSPVTASLGPGQQKQFSATNADESAVTWSASYGNITQSGLYTAPKTNTAISDSVIATSSSNGNHQAAAVVNVFPAEVEISPSFSQVNANGAGVQFSASSLEGGSISWAVKPQIGSISSSGLYTPPASVLTPQGVTMTASNGTGTGSALVVVFGELPTDVAVKPSFVSTPLGPGATQQFSAVVNGVQNASINWSILPAGVGSISATGLYRAPDNIAASQSVLVVATDSTISALFGTALVQLAPNSNGV